MPVSPVDTDPAVDRDPADVAESDHPTVDVAFWFDPVCPWAWMTSRWLIEAAAVRRLRPRWRVMSLSVLNEGRELSDDYARLMDDARGPVRVLAAVEERYGVEALGRLYTELGTRFHTEARPPDRETVSDALVAAGLPEQLADAADDASYDALVRASHDDGISRVGMDVGTPIVSVGNLSIFGPVVSPAPKGEAAGRLWDGLLLLAGTDGFFELKRSRDRVPIFD